MRVSVCVKNRRKTMRLNGKNVTERMQQAKIGNYAAEYWEKILG